MEAAMTHASAPNNRPVGTALRPISTQQEP